MNRNMEGHKVEIHHIGPFILGKTLGAGTTGKVKLAFHKDTGAKVAIKIINKEYLASRATVLKKVEREIAVMKVLEHPHVLRLYDVYETTKYLFLVLEYVEGGELFDYLVKKGRLEPEEALIIFQQIIGGMDYCHSHMICHRDLKPENLLLDGDKNIKIADFGMASLMRKGSLLSTSCGSPHYASPEVVMGIKYDGTSADVWSCGVILFALLTGKLPFDDDNIRRLLSKVKSGVFSMPQFLHKDIKDLISRMLTVDATKRMSMSQVKEHPWFRSNHIDVPRFVPPIEDMMMPLNVAVIDEEIVQSLHSLGWGAEDEIKAALLDDTPNLQQSFYRLLLNRKQMPPAEPYSKPNASQRVRGSSTPVLPVAPPPSSPRQIANIVQIPVSNNLAIIANSSVTPPGSPNPFRPSTPPLSPMEVSPKRRSSTTSTAPINIIGASNRLQRMKLENPPTGSPIIGSSPKRSWFSSFFAKSEKDQQPANKKERIVSLQSRRTMIEIISELQAVFNKCNIAWDMISTSTITARQRTLPMSQSIRFNVEIRSVGKDELHLISF